MKKYTQWGKKTGGEDLLGGLWILPRGLQDGLKFANIKYIKIISNDKSKH